MASSSPLYIPPTHTLPPPQTISSPTPSILPFSCTDQNINTGQPATPQHQPAVTHDSRIFSAKYFLIPFETLRHEEHKVAEAEVEAKVCSRIKVANRGLLDSVIAGLGRDREGRYD
ncbi:hypothetical protein E2C01_058422 [Portunus trituberculatus]|uniref:Uncharacterized protein n=1 Tax=Portunus trituberculatus TaxID=210409 RepID=A0A5B7GWE0_PORTR|nr:hypothetical protein [Portunus trituberculatus]